MTERRNVEEITDQRVAEFGELHDRLIAGLSAFGKHGISETDDFWVPFDVPYYRDLYIVLARESLLRRQVITEVQKILSSCRFIWVVVVHLADEKTDNRVLEPTRSEVVCLDPELGARAMRPTQH